MKVTTRKMHPNVRADLYVQLTEFAQRTHRSLNGAVIYFIEQGLRAEARKEIAK